MPFICLTPAWSLCSLSVLEQDVDNSAAFSLAPFTYPWAEMYMSIRGIQCVGVLLTAGDSIFAGEYNDLGRIASCSSVVRPDVAKRLLRGSAST